MFQIQTFKKFLYSIAYYTVECNLCRRIKYRLKSEFLVKMKVFSKDEIIFKFKK